MTLEIVSDVPSWDAAVQAVGDVSNFAGGQYVQACAAMELEGVAQLAVFRAEHGTVVHPFVRRAIPDTDGWSDLMSPFDYGGFFFDTTDEGGRISLLQAFEDAFFEYAADEGIVAGFTRLHPMRTLPLDALRRFQVRQHRDNIVIQLDRPYEELWKGYKRPRRRIIKQGRRAGFEIERSTDFTHFVPMFHYNMRRVGARPENLFPTSFFDAVADQLELYYLRAPDGTICAGHTYLLDPPYVFAYLCHSTPDYLHLRPNDFLYDHMLQEFRRRGLTWFHFGGGTQMSLWEYKATFSPQRVPYFVIDGVFRQDRYDELSNIRERHVPDCRSSGFFPAYRAGYKLEAPSATGQVAS